MKQQKVRSFATFVRPNDTTPYTAKDAVANSTSAPTVITFANAGAAIQKAGLLRGAKLTCDVATITNGSFRLHLYSKAPSVISNDNSAMSMPFADAPQYLGFVDFTLKNEGGTLAYDAVGGLALPVFSDGDDIYGLLEATAAYTPGAQENFRIELLLEA